jgi:hypothetical protein
MKIRSILLAYTFSFVLICTSTVLSEEISGKYCMNFNNYTGYMNINLSGNNLSGTLQFLTDPITGNTIEINDTIVNSQVTYGGNWEGKPTIGITWERASQEHTYYGWFSWDRKTISGYFDGYTDSNMKFPWFAELKDSCSDSSTATVESNLNITVPSANFGNSNIWFNLEYKALSGFDHLWKLKDYGVNE